MCTEIPDTYHHRHQDVEKLAVKKGITLQTVKEVLTSLVDDDLVHQERIGASNFFWSFPSEAANQVCLGGAVHCVLRPMSALSCEVIFVL